MTDPNIEWICNLKRKLQEEARSSPHSSEELRRIDELVDVYLEWYSLKNWTDWIKEAETEAKNGGPFVAKNIEKEQKE